MFAQPPKRQKLKDFNSIEDLVRHIKEARRILVLTGAGVSVRYNLHRSTFIKVDIYIENKNGKIHE